MFAQIGRSPIKSSLLSKIEPELHLESCWNGFVLLHQAIAKTLSDARDASHMLTYKPRSNSQVIPRIAFP